MFFIALIVTFFAAVMTGLVFLGNLMRTSSGPFQGKGIIFAAWLVAGLVWFGWWSPAFGQDHKGHPPEHQALHEKFYRTWMMPDQPQHSCCNDKDCYPTEARRIGNRWEAKRREDGRWLVVPPEKVEQNRDNPDGRNHLCAQPPSVGDRVFCFSAGNGT